MRKIISVILTAALLLTALAAVPASAAEQAADNPFRFSVLSDGTAQITHCNIREGNVTVPAKLTAAPLRKSARWRSASAR